MFLRTLAIATAAIVLTSPAHADILIGRLGSIDSPIAKPTTVAAAEGFDMYLKKINDAGGVHGQQLKVIFKDDQFKPDLVVSQARELIETDKVIALISPQGTPGTVGIIKDGMLKRDHVAAVGPVTGASQVLFGENVFPVCSTYEDEIGALARQMQNLNQKRVAYLYYNVSQGPLFAPVFEKIVKDAGLDYVGAQGFDIVPDPANQAKLVQQAVDKLTPMHPDAVFVFVVGPTFPMAIKDMSATLGAGIVRYTFSINNWETLVKAVGVETAAGTIFSQSVPYPYGSSRHIVSDYQHDLAKYSPEAKPSFVGLEGYMTARVLVEAINRAGPNPTPQKVLEALENFGRYDLGDYILNYSRVQHRVEPSVDVTMISRSGALIK